MTVARTTLALLLIGTAMPALAQSGAQSGAQVAADTIANDDIIVTTQKREERGVDVPITLTATLGERMRQLGVSDLDELAFFVPGLNIQEQSANNPGIVIRGITSDSGSAQQAARFTLYYNGVDISRSRGSYQDLYDIERVEVVKGPQATLFGTASAVGAISIISARPRPGFSGELSGGIANYNGYQLGGHILAGDDVLARRVAFAFKKRDGYVNNPAPGQDDLNGQNQFGVRASIRYAPSADISADLILTYDRQRNPGTAFVSLALPTATGPGNAFGNANLGGSPLSATVLGVPKLGLRRDVYDANLTVNWNFADDWSLTMVNNYRKFDSLEVFDADGSARAGAGEGRIPLTDAAVEAAVATYLAENPDVGSRFVELELVAAEAVDGRSAHVELRALVRPVLISWVTAPWSDGIVLEAESDARAW